MIYLQYVNDFLAKREEEFSRSGRCFFPRGHSHWLKEVLVFLPACLTKAGSFVVRAGYFVVSTDTFNSLFKLKLKFSYFNVIEREKSSFCSQRH